MTENLQEISLDGVIYARLRHNGQNWHLGAVNPAWKEILGGLANNPAPEDLAALESRGIWLAPEGPPRKLAVACCGLGSGWAGMGRELYDNFPEARRAMDALASLSEWDLLGLLDNDDLESISQIRLQIPHLFLLEYAQWRQFVSLGLSPTLLCGHSLGELVALCLAGVYDEKAAWLLFDRRAQHINSLENRLEQKTGMLAIHADEDVVRETLAEWPTLSLANRNTPRQFIVGGDREALLMARKSLRKRRIPAMLLNVPLAFHNPAMRILRDFSLRRLAALEMSPPKIPVLSNVTCGFYPQSQEDICRFIIDLDENAVDWIGCANVMGEREKIDIFLELGPAHTLGGLIEELLPGRIAIAADHREMETDAMRSACARLFSLGLLNFEKIIAQKNGRPRTVALDEITGRPSISGKVSSQPPLDEDIKKIIVLIANASGRKVEEISCDLDLRNDLAMRSSSFPLLVQKAENELGLNVEYENLLQVNTVGDLALALLGRQKKYLLPAHSRIEQKTAAPLRRFILETRKAKETGPGEIFDARPQLLLYDVIRRPLPDSDCVILVIGEDTVLLHTFWRGLEAFGAMLVTPRGTVFPGFLNEDFNAAEFSLSNCQVNTAELPVSIMERFGRLDAIFVLPPPFPDSSFAPDLGIIFENARTLSPSCGIFVLQRFCDMESGKFLKSFANWRAALPVWSGGCAVAIQDNDEKFREDEIGDLVALEFLHGEGASFWAREPYFSGEGGVPQLFAKAEDFPLAIADHAMEYPGEPLCLKNISWFSTTFNHVDNAKIHNPFSENFSDIHGQKENYLKEGRKLAAMLEGARKLLSWLTPVGFSDIRFLTSLEMSPGIARECRLECHPLFWMNHEKKMTRIVTCSLAARKISANGRRLNEYEAMVDGLCYLCAKAASPSPVGEFHKIQDKGMEALTDSGVLNTANGANAAIRMGKTGEREWLGCLQSPVMPIAMGKKGGYAEFFRLFDCLIDAARLTMANPEYASQFHCAGVGYLNFNIDDYTLANTNACGHLVLFLKLVLMTDKFMRFNGQIGSEAGKIFMVAHNLEFEKNPDKPGMEPTH